VCPDLALYWTAELHTRLVQALADADEAIEALRLAIDAYDPRIAPVDSTAPRVETEIATLAAAVPPEEWDRIPADFNDNLDVYLYGHR
jgi:hypothetical protein